MKKVEDILHTLRPAGMTVHEKARIREAVAAFADAHPAAPAPVLSPYARFASAFSGTHAFQALAVILLIACGAITVAANGALPGEALYPVKVNVNEQVSGLTAVTPQAKAAHESALAETRLDEAADLSAQGKLTPEVRTQIEENFQAHVANVQKSVDKLQSQDDARGAVEVSSNLESALQAHEKVLSDLSDRSQEAGTIASNVRQQLTTISGRLSSLEQQVTSEVTTDSAEQARIKSDQAEEKIDEAKEVVASAKGEVSSEVLADAQARIDSAMSSLAEGYSNTKDGAYNLAFINFQSAVSHSLEAEVIINAGKNLKIDDREDGGKQDEPATTTDDHASSTPSKTGTTSDSVLDLGSVFTGSTSTLELGATTTGAAASTSAGSTTASFRAAVSAKLSASSAIGTTTPRDAILTHILKTVTNFGL